MILYIQIVIKYDITDMKYSLQYKCLFNVLILNYLD